MNQIYETTEFSQAVGLSWSSLLSRTYSLYRHDFWVFFRAGLPAAILVYLFKSCQHTLGDALLKWMINPRTYRPAVISIGLIENAFYWLASTIFFAAIAARIIGSNEADALLADGYSAVRPKIKPLLAVGLITWTLFFLVRGVIDLLLVLAFSRVRVRPVFSLSLVIYGVPLLMVAGLLSRFALAVPEIVDGHSRSIREAIRNSIRKTENWEPFFMLFLTKSATMGYAVYWLVQRGFEQVWRRMSPSASVYYWFTWAVYVCLLAVLESPLFIAFSLLYCESAVKQEDAQTAAVIAQQVTG